MANFYGGSPWSLPNGSNLWFADSVPSLSTDAVSSFQLYDLLMLVGAAAQSGLIYRLIGVPSTTYPGGQWQEVAEGVRTTKSVSAAYTINGTTDDIITVTGASAIAVTLPSAAAYPGHAYTVNRVGAGNGTVVCAGSDKMGNAHTTATFGADESSVTVVSDGTQWQITIKSGTVSIS